jgi:hypothetical protein
MLTQYEKIIKEIIYREENYKKEAKVYEKVAEELRILNFKY